MATDSTSLKARQQRVDGLLQSVLGTCHVATRLQEAMQYAAMGGGKRLRPLLAYAGAEAVGGDPAAADIAAVAVELIHAYSLVHDDLPAMDDDELRRGKPTCHIAFDEATAILAGDALQTLAFELLADSAQLPASQGNRLLMISELARASGAAGMVAGQMLDIEAAGNQLGEAALGRMHSLKTGALITASVLLGALGTNLATAAQLDSLRKFAALAGLAFQIKDDLLDVEAETAVIGKQQGKDAARNKPTYTSLFGINGAKQRLAEAVSQADSALVPDLNADGLRELLRLIAERHY
jgi:geranylgeranyl diphosphate synthase type II